LIPFLLLNTAPRASDWRLSSLLSFAYCSSGIKLGSWFPFVVWIQLHGHQIGVLVPFSFLNSAPRASDWRLGSLFLFEFSSTGIRLASWFPFPVWIQLLGHQIGVLVPFSCLNSAPRASDWRLGSLFLFEFSSTGIRLWLWFPFSFWILLRGHQIRAVVTFSAYSPLIESLELALCFETEKASIPFKRNKDFFQINAL